MLFGFSLIVVLLCDTVLANGCSETYRTSPGSIAAKSQENITSSSCIYYLEGDRGHYAVLNFTGFHGFPLPEYPPGQEEKEERQCRPLVQIMEIIGEGAERFLGNICHATPRVFHSNSHMVKMAFTWLPRQQSGFNLLYNFHEQGSACQFQCAEDRTCLPDINLICNGVPDCQQGSDEEDCLRPKDPSLSSTGWAERNKSLLQMVIVVTILVLVLGLVLGCILLYHRIGPRLIPASDADHRHLTSRSSSHIHNSEVVYVPGMGNTEPNSDIRITQTQYPISIPISDDGEGGYIPPNELRSVHDELRRSFVPAPNRTANEGESPPPYRSRSVGYLDHRDYPGWSQRNDYQEHATSRRTYSMSSGNKNYGKGVVTGGGCGGGGGVTAASSTSPLLGSSRSTCTSSPTPAFYHHTHPPPNSCRSPHVRTQRSVAAAVPRVVCPIQPPGPTTDYQQQQPARAAPAPTTPPSSLSPSSSELPPQERCHDHDSLGPPPDYTQAVAAVGASAGARTHDL